MTIDNNNININMNDTRTVAHGKKPSIRSDTLEHIKAARNEEKRKKLEQFFFSHLIDVLNKRMDGRDSLDL